MIPNNLGNIPLSPQKNIQPTYVIATNVPGHPTFSDQNRTGALSQMERKIGVPISKSMSPRNNFMVTNVNPPIMSGNNNKWDALRTLENNHGIPPSKQMIVPQLNSPINHFPSKEISNEISNQPMEYSFYNIPGNPTVYGNTPMEAALSLEKSFGVPPSKAPPELFRTATSTNKGTTNNRSTKLRNNW